MSLLQIEEAAELRFSYLAFEQKKHWFTNYVAQSSPKNLTQSLSALIINGNGPLSKPGTAVRP